MSYLLFFALAVAFLAFATCGSNLVAPDYQIFTSDYVLPLSTGANLPNATINISFHYLEEDGFHVNVTNVQPWVKKEVSLPCGVIDRPGRWEICWVANGWKENCETAFNATFPFVTFDPVTYTSTHLSIPFSPSLCHTSPVLSHPITAAISILLDPIASSYGLTSKEPRIDRYSNPIDNRSTDAAVRVDLRGREVVVELCDLEVVQRIRVTLMSNATVIAQSPILTLKTSMTPPRLVMPEVSIRELLASCQDHHGIKVAIDNQVCKAQSKLLRIFGVQVIDEDGPTYVTLPLSSQPPSQDYLTEVHLETSTGLIPCEVFFHRLYRAYCFALTGIDPVGRVVEWDRVCLPYVKGDTPQWSAWSEWSQCSAACGQGESKRTRICQRNPRNVDGCSGEFFETRECWGRLCYDHSSPSIITLNRTECSCGCTVTSASILFIQTFNCENTSLWSVHGGTKHVKLRTVDFRSWDSEISDKTPEYSGQKSQSRDVARFSIRDGSEEFDDLMYDELLSEPKIWKRGMFFVTASRNARLELTGSGPKGFLAMEVGFMDDYEYALMYGLPLENRLSPWAFLVSVTFGFISTALFLVITFTMFLKHTFKQILLKSNMIMSQSVQTTSSCYDPLRPSNRLSTSSQMVEDFDVNLQDFGRADTNSDAGTPMTQRESIDIDSPQSCLRYPLNVPVSNRNSAPLLRRTLLHKIPEVPEESRALKCLSKEITQTFDSLQSEVTSSPHLSFQRRSIGIQLNSNSGLAVPASPIVRSKGQLSTGSSTLSIPSCSGRGSPELEYDYYDAPMMGSFLNPVEEELNIDDILAECELLKGTPTPTPRSSD